MKVQFLGTGAGLPSKFRFTQSTILDLNPLKQEFWLFDACEGVQHQILHTNIKLSKLTNIFITHLHGDHIFGLPGLLTSRSFQGGEGKELKIYGPKGLKTYIDTTLNISGSHLNYPLEVIEFDQNHYELNIGDIHLTVHQLNHGIDSFGYRIAFPEIMGNIIREKLEALNILPGPIYQKFKTDETVEIDGTIYETKHFRTENIKGKILAFFGDTKPCEEECLLAQNADLVVHECTYLEGDVALSHKYYHTHFNDIVHLAKESQAKRFLLNHISNRYVDEDLNAIITNLKTQYPNIQFECVNDFDVFEI